MTSFTYRLELLLTEEAKEYYTINETRNNDNAGYDMFVTGLKLTNNQCLYVELGVRARMVCLETDEEVHYRLVPRSSIWKSGVMMANSEGIIDRSYRGIIMGVVVPLSGSDIPEIKMGIRLFQIVAPDLGHIKQIKIVDSLPETSRGEKGFGSSGL